MFKFNAILVNKSRITLFLCSKSFLLSCTKFNTLLVPQKTGLTNTIFSNDQTIKRSNDKAPSTAALNTSAMSQVNEHGQALIVRRSIFEMQKEYDNGNKKPLEDLVRAWIGVKNLPVDDLRSFFSLAGYHGQPFNLRKENNYYWGGYCNHGNVLFPTWHRFYVAGLEKALQSVVPGIGMPFWDQTDPEALEQGIPRVLTQPKFELDGVMVDNPFVSYTLPVGLVDNLARKDDFMDYSKPAGYTTVRYPLSGLVGTDYDRKSTAAHNARFPDPKENVEILNDNLRAWIRGGKPTEAEPNPQGDGVYTSYKRALKAPNYTVFSNTTSAAAWNKDHPGITVALENPHNDIHLAVGGFDSGSSQKGQISGANGDMGENNTASFDPIFFFHHTNIDRVFWLWQKEHGQTDRLDIMHGYPGTNSSDGDEGTPTGIPANTDLTLDTPLKPFVRRLSQPESFFTSRDGINIEKQLGYTYGKGSLEATGSALTRSISQVQKVKEGYSQKKLSVSHINRAERQGSFVLRAFALVRLDSGEIKEYPLGLHSVLNRRDPSTCKNCKVNGEVVASFPLSAIREEDVAKAEFKINLLTSSETVPMHNSDFKLEVLD